MAIARPPLYIYTYIQIIPKPGLFVLDVGFRLFRGILPRGLLGTVPDPGPSPSGPCRASKEPAPPLIFKNRAHHRPLAALPPAGMSPIARANTWQNNSWQNFWFRVRAKPCMPKAPARTDASNCFCFGAWTSHWRGAPVRARIVQGLLRNYSLTPKIVGAKSLVSCPGKLPRTGTDARDLAM